MAHPPVLASDAESHFQHTLTGSPMIERSYKDISSRRSIIMNPGSLIALSAGVGVIIWADMPQSLALLPVGIETQYRAKRGNLPQHEVTTGIGLGVGGDSVKPHRRNPLYVAHSLEALKRSFTSNAHRYGVDHISFEAVQQKGKKAAGLHLNASLINTDGKNLMATADAKPNALLKCCIQGILDIQNEGSLLMLKDQNSLARFKNGGSSAAPNRIYHRSNKWGAATVSARYANWTNWLTQGKNERAASTRAENRMAGG